MKDNNSKALKAEIEKLGPWYHSIDINGELTPGRAGNITQKFHMIENYFEEDLSNKKVIDIGCNACGVGIEFAKRGARVTGYEAVSHYYRQAVWASKKLNLNIELKNKSVYDIKEESDPFDYVLFLGLIYHLRYPQLALDLANSICSERIFINTPIILSSSMIMEYRVPDSPSSISQSEESKYNWWYPSEKCLIRMLEISGFCDVEVIRKTEDTFSSSSSHVNNESDYKTGQIFLSARVSKNHKIASFLH